MEKISMNSQINVTNILGKLPAVYMGNYNEKPVTILKYKKI